MRYEWQYSRSRQRHTLSDGEWHKGYKELWEIISLHKDQWGCFDKSRGYDLYHKGDKCAHADTVKELKQIVQERR